MLKYLAQFLTIFIIYLLGIGLASWLNLPVPGSIVGLALLFLGLMSGVIKLSWVEDISQLHIKHITLLFLPFTVGVFHYSQIFKLDGLKLTVVLALSSLSVFFATAFIAELYDIRRKRGN